MLGDPEYLKTADLLFNYIDRFFVDKAYGGTYWMLDHAGRPLDSIKKFYGQSFTMYGLTEYAKASGSVKALDMAYELFSLCEKYGRDRKHGGYIESRARDWSESPDLRLSDREPASPKSMNTNLHVMEALATLGGYYRDPKVLEALESIIDVYITKILQPNGHFGMFFSMEWKKLSELMSYGHDIEGSWLLTEAAEFSGNMELLHSTEKAAMFMAETAIKEAIDADGGIFCEGDEKGPHKMFKEWWAQPEGMVGFMNAYQYTKDDKYIEQSLAIWEYCKKKLLRPGGEWYFYVSADGSTDTTKDLAGPWKCPYHTGRACIETSERLEKILSQSL
jgi:mannobiose 2-epimerase